MPFALITKDDVSQLTKGLPLPTEFDYLLDKIIIPAVGKIFANHCRRQDWDKVQRSQYFSPREKQKYLNLGVPPVVQDPSGSPAIPNVQVWQNFDLPRAYGSADLLVNGEDYFVHEDEGIIEHVSSFAGGPKTVKVTYTGGYLTADGQGTPADLRLAAIAQTKIIFDRREELGVSSRSQEGGAITMLNVLTLPRSVTMMLDNYVMLRA